MTQKQNDEVPRGKTQSLRGRKNSKCQNEVENYVDQFFLTKEVTNSFLQKKRSTKYHYVFNVQASALWILHYDMPSHADLSVKQFLGGGGGVKNTRDRCSCDIISVTWRGPEKCDSIQKELKKNIHHCIEAWMCLNETFSYP
jgi:hypothetical protein